MKRMALLALAGSLLMPGSASAAETATESGSRELCVTVTGAPGDVSSGALLAGLLNGSITIESVRECSTTTPPDPATPGPPTGDTGPTGRWVVMDPQKDALTDAESVGAILLSDDDPDIAIMIACYDGNAAVSVGWDHYIDSDADVQHRLDDGAVATAPWTVSDKNTLLLFSSAIDFTKSMFGADKLVVRGKTVLGDSLTATFTITGVENAVQTARDACDW